MLILTIRTDKPEAEVGLYKNNHKLAYSSWEAHRILAETLHQQAADMLFAQGQTWADIGGVIVFEGPGSFTGLRIGLSVANALAAAKNLPIAAGSGADWIAQGYKKIAAGLAQRQVLPRYGSLPHITQPKK